MTNPNLGFDLLKRGRKRLSTVEFQISVQHLYADAVRECQESLELGLKGFFRIIGQTPPHKHDLSLEIRGESIKFPEPFQTHRMVVAQLSWELKKDRELSFYGDEEVTPSEHYTKKIAQAYLDQCLQVYAWISASLNISLDP